MGARAIIASAANSKYFPLLKGLVLSLRQQKTISDLPMITFDVGLRDDEKAWLSRQKVSTIRIGWDFEFLATSGVTDIVKAQSVRPFLPRHLPDADVYLWMDADMWIQNENAVLLAVDCAQQSGALVAVPEISRFYRSLFVPPREIRQAEFAIYKACFGLEVANRLVLMPLVNSGFFAMAKNSGGWQLWASVLEDMYRKSTDFYTEQTSLNFCIYARNMPFLALPAYCNWTCIWALPAFDETREKFVEPGPPTQDIWIVHLAGPAKEGEHLLRTTTGKTIRRSLRFPSCEIPII